MAGLFVIKTKNGSSYEIIQENSFPFGEKKFFLIFKGRKCPILWHPQNGPPKDIFYFYENKILFSLKGEPRESHMLHFPEADYSHTSKVVAIFRKRIWGEPKLILEESA